MKILSCLLAAIVTFSASAIAQTPVEHFARLPAAKGLSISPDGTRIAFISHVEDRIMLVVENLDTGEQVGAAADDLRVFDTFWADNNTILARVGALIDVHLVRGDVDVNAFITFDADTLEGQELVRNRIRDGINFDATRLVGRDPETGHLLIALRDDRGRLNVYPIDQSNGRRGRVIHRGHQTTRYWVSDSTGERFAEARYSGHDNVFSILITDEAGTRTILEQERELIPMGLMGFTQSGDLVVSTGARNENRTRQLSRMDADTGEFVGTLFNDPEHDYENVRLDYHLNHVAGVTIERERGETVWFDEELANRQATLENIFEGMTVTLIDWSEDRQRFIFATSTNMEPPTYYLVDFAISDARAIKLAFPELFDVQLAERTPTFYPARDGTQIPAYIALPEGDGPHPFVILVHGGPAARDTGGFHYMAHFLTSRGYGVIQPQFRGSRGFGFAWETDGWGEWGTGLMQHDVSDAVAYLRSEGLASRICTAGSSYGGYAALAGATFTPDLYDCAVSINGLSDMPQFLEYVDDRHGSDSQTARYWAQSISGNTTRRVSRDQMLALSPSRHADAVTIPVLIMAGEDDTVVPVLQSHIMQRNLSRAGADVDYVRLEGGDHWLLEYPTRVRVLQEVERFLAQHLAE